MRRYVLCEKLLLKLLSNLYVLRPRESEKTVFPIKLYEIRKKIIVQNCLLQKDFA